MNEVEFERISLSLSLSARAVSVAEHVGLQVAEPDTVSGLADHGGLGFD